IKLTRSAGLNYLIVKKIIIFPHLIRQKEELFVKYRVDENRWKEIDIVSPPRIDNLVFVTKHPPEISAPLIVALPLELWVMASLTIALQFLYCYKWHAQHTLREKFFLTSLSPA